MKRLLKITALLLIVISFSSCATIFGGKVTTCQRTKPLPGEPRRQIRVVPFVLDFWSGVLPLAVDFGTGAIYKPCDQDKNKKK